MNWYCRQGADSVKLLETLSKTKGLLAVDPLRHGCIHSDGPSPSLELRTLSGGRLSAKYYSSPANSNCTMIKDIDDFFRHHQRNTSVTIKKKLQDFDCFISHMMQTGMLPRNPSEAQLSLHQLFKVHASQFCEWIEERKAQGKTGVSVLYSHAASAIAFLQHQLMAKDTSIWLSYGAMATRESKERERNSARHQKHEAR